MAHKGNKPTILVLAPRSDQLSYSILLGTNAMERGICCVVKFQAVVTLSMCDPIQILDNRPKRNENLPYDRHHLFNLLILSFGILVHWEGWVNKDPVGEEKIYA